MSSARSVPRERCEEYVRLVDEIKSEGERIKGPRKRATELRVQFLNTLKALPEKEQEIQVDANTKIVLSKSEVDAAIDEASVLNALLAHGIDGDMAQTITNSVFSNRGKTTRYRLLVKKLDS